jgi:phytoene dehydrogenase-like protein
MSGKKDYDAIVVGSGPNGLAASITLQKSGLSVLLIEAKDTIGGGLRSAELTMPGFIHDVCSAVHPLAVSSPFFKSISLEDYGLQFIHAPIAAAHPFQDGTAAALFRSIDETVTTLNGDGKAYRGLIEPLLSSWPELSEEIFGPFHFPRHPFAMARFGIKGLSSATHLVKHFHSKEARALWGGMAAHSVQPLSNLATSAFGLVMILTGHASGWPIVKGGSNQIANALVNYFISLGGKVETNFHVQSLSQLPSADAFLFDVAPKQLLQIAGDKFSSFYKWQLKRYRYGMGVFKIDWALSEPIPFTSPLCKQAGTIHVGNTFEEIVASEQLTADGNHSEHPFVLLAQQSLFDPSRAPQGKQTAWAYCHVPNGSPIDMTERIENQVERFAPGFRDTIIARHTMNAQQVQQYNPNYVGGDINGGVIDITQLFSRPALRLSPYRTSANGIYICSSSTPPGGGVHGMCGYHAAMKAMKDVFHR